MTDAVVRPATEADVPALNAIYNTYIVDSHVSFDTEPWSDAARVAWFRERHERGYPVLVAERNGTIVGTSWSGPWRDKAAYRASVESTVVLAGDAVGAGVGSQLLGALIEELADRRFRTAIAIIALPNDASVALHRKLGYRMVGILEAVGRKDGREWDTALMQRSLAPEG